jgi:PKD repeat protein
MKTTLVNLIFIGLLLFSPCIKAKVVIITPKSIHTQIDTTLDITWNDNVSSENYKVQISTDNSFSALMTSINTASRSYNLTFNNYGTYFIRVKGNHDVNWSNIVQVNIVDIKSNARLTSWFKADTANVNTTNGNSVNEWRDQSNTLRNATQNNLSSMPLFVNSVPLINNKGVLAFNRTGNDPSYLDINIPINAATYSLFVVQNYYNNSNRVQFFLSGDRYIDGVPQGFFSEVDAFGGGFGQFGNNGSVGTAIFSEAKDLSLNYSLFNYSNDYLEKNTRNIQPLRFIGPSTYANNLSLSMIGTEKNNTPYAYQGEIAEMIFYDTTVDYSLKDNIYNYLRDKYAPPVNLGGDTVLGTSFSDTVALNAGNRFVKYRWSTGDTTPTTKVISSGSYKVKTTDVFGFESEDEIEVYPYRRFKNTTINICKGDSIKINLGLDASYNILWSNGKTTSTVYLKDAGQYTLKITKNGKSVFDTLNILVDQTYLSIPYTAPKVIDICLNEKLYLYTSSSFDSIYWSTGSNQNYISITAPGLYKYYAKTDAGCIYRDTFNVNIRGQAPVANFTVLNSCQNSNTYFSDISNVPLGNNIQSWKWTFSNGSMSTDQNPYSIFQLLGSASATLKIMTNAGCSDSIFKSFTINKRPVASFYNLLSCSGIPTTFIDQTVANSAAVTNWNWDFNGLGVINGIQNPSFSFPTSGDYYVRLKATNSNGCSDTVTLLTTVNVSPVADFSYDSVCGRVPVSLKYLATIEPPGTIPNLNWGSWDFGDGTIETAIRSPQHRYSAPGTYNVVLQINSTGGCSDTAVRQVKVYDFPIVDFTVSQTQCVGKEIQFSDITATPDGTPVTKWNWFFAGQGTSEAQNPRYTFNEQGNYTIQLNAKNAVGCSGTKLRSIAVSAPPQPKFTFSPQNGLPPLCVTYTNQSPVNGNYIWDYGDGGSLIEGFNPPQHCYNTIGTYPIKLIATDFRGCTESLTKFILVDKANLDAVMTSVTIIPNGEFYKIQVSIKNNSNIEITALGLSLQLGGGSVIRENWSGSLLPGQTTVYIFTGEIKPGENRQIPVVCATIDNVNNNAAEDRTDNNTACKELSVGSFDVLNIYPNPALDNINFGIMLPKDGKVNIRFIDVLGQQMYSKDFDGVKGYNNLNMSTMLLNAAVYVAEVSFDGEIVRKKFMRKDRK